jgi:hypothetical protein
MSSSHLATRAELERLGQLVGVDAAALEGLAPVPIEDLRWARQRATDVLFDGHREVFARLAGASRLLPPPLVATIARKAFGPLLSARITGHLEPRRARDVAKHLRPSFLADVAVSLDPRRAADVIAAIPGGTVAEVASLLLERDEHVAAARFIDVIPKATIDQIIPSVDDGDLLHLAFLADAPDVLDAIVADLDDERIASIIATADRSGLWGEAISLIDQVSPAQRTRLADIAAAQDDALVTSLVEAVVELSAWEALLPMVAGMSEAGRTRFAKLPALHRVPVLTAIVEAAARTDRWVDLLPIVPDLPAAARRKVARLAAALDQGLQRQAIEAAASADRWPVLVSIAADMEPSARAQLVDLVDEVGEDAARGLVGALADDERLQAAALEVVGSLEPAVRARLAERARDLGVLDQLGDLAPALTA